MRQITKIVLLSGALAFFSAANAEENAAEKGDSTEVVADSTVADSAAASTVEAKPEKEPQAEVQEEVVTEEAGPSMNQVIKQKMSEGGLTFMGIVLVCLIIGLIVAVERIITLTTATTNTKTLMSKIKDALSNGGIQEAKELCARTKGPVAAIFAQGLIRSDQGLDAVQTSVENYGATEMGRLEKGMTWISLFIALAPMFGFMGTVLGMIGAFDSIETVGEIKIDKIAGDIKVALLTTVAGLIVAVILQFFYNYIVSKIDSISGEMEDASNKFIDLLIVSKKLTK